MRKTKRKLNFWLLCTIYHEFTRMAWDLFPVRFHWEFARANRKWVQTLFYSRHWLNSNNRTFRDGWLCHPLVLGLYRFLLFALYSHRPASISPQSVDWFVDFSHAVDSVDVHEVAVSALGGDDKGKRWVGWAMNHRLAFAEYIPAAQYRHRATSHECIWRSPKCRLQFLRRYSARCWFQRVKQLSIGTSKRERERKRGWCGRQSRTHKWRWNETGTYFWFDIVQNTVLNTPQRILCLIHVNAKIERMQRSEILIPCLRMLQRFQHAITDENYVWILFPALGQESLVLRNEERANHFLQKSPMPTPTVVTVVSLTVRLQC